MYWEDGDWLVYWLTERMDGPLGRSDLGGDLWTGWEVRVLIFMFVLMIISILCEAMLSRMDTYFLPSIFRGAGRWTEGIARANLLLLRCLASK